MDKIVKYEHNKIFPIRKINKTEYAKDPGIYLLMKTKIDYTKIY